MGSNKVKAVTINKPFSIRDYVFAARQKDISKNWPFSKKYLQTSMERGIITKVLPPFESRNSVRNPSYKDEENSDSPKEDKAHNIKEEIIKVYNIDVSTARAIPSFDKQMDQCLIAVPSSKSLESKVKQGKGNEHKNWSLTDICAKARPCTVEELDKINGTDWAIDQHVIYGGGVTSEKVVDEVNGSMNPTEDNQGGTKSAETIWKKKHPSDDNAENGNVENNRSMIPKIKLDGHKPKLQNVKVNPRNCRITNESKIHDIPVAKSQGNCSSTKEMESEPVLQNQGGNDPKRSALLWPNNSIEASKDSGDSDMIKLRARGCKRLKGLDNNSFKHHPSVMSRKKNSCKKQKQ